MGANTRCGMLVGVMKYCVLCDTAQGSGSRCWSCGSRELSNVKPAGWPESFPVTAGSQTVQFPKTKRNSAFVEGVELPEQHSMDAIVRGNVKP